MWRPKSAQRGKFSPIRATCAVWLQIRVLILGLSLGLPALAAFDFGDSNWEGCSEFLSLAREALGKDRVELVATLDYDTLTKEDGIIVLHPEATLNYDALLAFMRSGGRFAVLDDHGAATSFLTRFNIHRNSPPEHPAFTLRNNSWLPIALPVTEEVVAGRHPAPHSIVAGVQNLMTNHPTVLSHPNLTPVLKIPAIGEPDATLAVTGIIGGRGRLFVMGDPSALINQMLRFPGNRAFAKGLIHYMVDDDTWGKRSGKLYLVAGAFRQKGNYGDDRTNHKLEQALQTLREWLAELRAHGLPKPLQLALALAAVAFILYWSLRNTARTYDRPLPLYAEPVPLILQGGWAGRAALLTAPTTSRALILLELGRALFDALCSKLKRPTTTARLTLIGEAAERSLLNPAQCKFLTAMAAEMSRIEHLLLAQQNARIPVRNLLVFYEDAQAILKTLGYAPSAMGMSERSAPTKS